MDKKDAIRILTKCAKIYHENLEDQKVLFLYGVPAEIKKQIERGEVLQLKAYEVVFHRQNYLHLTGVKVNDKSIKSSIHFYEKCLKSRLTENDFSFASDGSTKQKLEILENLIQIKKNATMLGDFSDRGIKLYTEKVAGNVCGCMGFVQDKYTKQNVPNSLLKKDIRDVIMEPKQKIYAVLGKKYKEENYSVLYKCDKALDILNMTFFEEVEKKIDKEAIMK